MPGSTQRGGSSQSAQMRSTGQSRETRHSTRQRWSTAQIQSTGQSLLIWQSDWASSRQPSAPVPSAPQTLPGGQSRSPSQAFVHWRSRQTNGIGQSLSRVQSVSGGSWHAPRPSESRTQVSPMPQSRPDRHSRRQYPRRHTSGEAHSVFRSHCVPGWKPTREEQDANRAAQTSHPTTSRFCGGSTRAG